MGLDFLNTCKVSLLSYVAVIISFSKRDKIIYIYHADQASQLHKELTGCQLQIWGKINNNSQNNNSNNQERNKERKREREREREREKEKEREKREWIAREKYNKSYRKFRVLYRQPHRSDSLKDNRSYCSMTSNRKKSMGCDIQFISFHFFRWT